jgi:hypothetical protein
MALFLMDHHPTKIMILGRWKSEAFMDYIRPQVFLEWTNLMSGDMVAFDSFTDLVEFGKMGQSSRSKKLGRNSDCLHQGYTLTTEQTLLEATEKWLHWSWTQNHQSEPSPKRTNGDQHSLAKPKESQPAL